MILRIEDALDVESCRNLIHLYHRHIDMAQKKDYTGHPILYCLLADIDAAARDLVIHIVRECLRTLTSSFQPSEPIYPETVILAGIGIGGHHLRHADNRRMDEHGAWIPNHVPQRDFSALFYLNGDFEGGEIVFENQDTVIKPRTGLLIAFPSNQDYVHEVLPVRSGRRYSMPIWFTRSPYFAMPDFVSQEREARQLED